MSKFTVYTGPETETENGEKVDAVWVHDTGAYFDVAWWSKNFQVARKMFGFESSMPEDNLSYGDAAEVVEEIVETILSWEGWAEAPRTPRADPPGRWYPCVLRDGVKDRWLRRYIPSGFARKRGDGMVTIFCVSTGAWKQMTSASALDAYRLIGAAVDDQEHISNEYFRRRTS